MGVENYIQLSDPTECINCGATIWKTYDVEHKEEFWATDNGTVHCNGKRHVPMEY